MSLWSFLTGEPDVAIRSAAPAAAKGPVAAAHTATKGATVIYCKSSVNDWVASKQPTAQASDYTIREAG